MSRMTAGPWFTDGLVVWAHSAAGPAICAARNLTASEGTFAPVASAEEQRANMVAIAALPALVAALNTFATNHDACNCLTKDEYVGLQAALALLETPAPPP